MWIENNSKKEYLDSAVKGLRIYSQKKVNPSLRVECLKFCQWLRKRFWFPIRVNLWLLSFENFKMEIESERKETAVFHYQTTWDEKPKEKKIFPKIFIATGKYEKQVSKHGEIDTLYNYFFNISHELTHYYQWYFYEFESRSTRSLEIEANSWADELAHEYLNVEFAKGDQVF